MTLGDALRLFRALVDEGVDFVVIGAMAMAAQGLPRTTADIDLFVAPRLDNIEALKRALRRLFDDPDIDQLDARELIGDYPAVEYNPPEEGFSIDILTRLGEAFDWDDISAGAEDVMVEDVRIRVAGPRLLFRMKKDTVRPRDRADAAQIYQAFDLGESE